MKPTDQHTQGQTGLAAAWLDRSRSFRRWQQVRQAILDHKWYESERAGHDIGWDRAAIDYLIRFTSRGSTKCDPAEETS